MKVLESNFSHPKLYSAHPNNSITPTRFSYVHAHIVIKMADVHNDHFSENRKPALSVLAVSCFKEVNVKLSLDDTECACA